MQVHRFDHVLEFWEITQDYLLQHEADHNALIGIVQTLLDHPERYSEPPYLALVEANARILAIALRTPPNNLLLSKARDLNALSFIAQDLQQEPLPGAIGLVAEAEAFVQAWHELTGQFYQRDVESRLFQLTQVKPVPRVSGYLRLATESDHPLLIQWFTAFASEMTMAVSDDIERRVEVELKRQSTYLWEDIVPVSMAGGRPFSASAARIAPVYTPPQYRCKGYATACVAALSQKLLEQGCDRCYLFTDLANSTSNHIYQEIGYSPVCDYHEYLFI